MKIFFTLFFSCLFFSAQAQERITIKVIDQETETALIGVKVFITATGAGGMTNVEGEITLDNLPAENFDVSFRYLGYYDTLFTVKRPLNFEATYVFSLVSKSEELDEIIVEATRSNKSIANLPTRTEVLTDEIDEAASMEASKISHLITHSTGIQVQTTSATSNGAVVRVQGLNGRYTQLLKDGFPMFGGFSGSLDIMQIPPLDLRQVEYIKGSASTLYGGGAIGGLINLLSKKPNSNETLLHLNVSHIGAKDFNSFTSRRFGKWGFTNLASLHTHSPYDADTDGYTDIAQVAKFNFNPKLYFYPDKKTELYLGAMVTNDNRAGGDMKLLENESPDTNHFYYDRQTSKRYTSQFLFARELGEKSRLTVKNSLSYFNRYIDIRKNKFGQRTRFAGNQINSFSEVNYTLNAEKHNLNIGLNFYTDQFKEQDLSNNPLRNQYYTTTGAYVNHLWDIHEKFSLETGFRSDYVIANSSEGKNGGEVFYLPRISALYKLAKSFSIRAGGGMGYRMPTIFNEESEPYGYESINSIDFKNVTAERSINGNIDFKFQSTFGTDNILLSLNQMFFYNVIDNAVLLFQTGSSLSYLNSGQVQSRGFESQIKLTFWQFTWFFGYTYTDAYWSSGNVQSSLTLTPTHSIKGDLLFVEEDKWRIGWDYELKSAQLLSTGQLTPSLFTTGVIVERTLQNFVIFLNAENFTDVRQSKYGSIISLPNETPQFTEIWAPLDGFFFNAGLKIKL